MRARNELRKTERKSPTTAPSDPPDDLLKKAETNAPPENATVKGKMAYRLKTKERRAIYKKRKETVEPALGVVKFK
jgi:hypothetical protein